MNKIKILFRHIIKTKTIITFYYLCFVKKCRALADTDADGKMNLIEFSIACKLISSKLRNVEVPKLLPPTLIASLQHIGTPIRTPTGTMSPTEGYKQFLTQQPQYTQNIPQQQVQPQPIIQPQAAVPQIISQATAMPQSQYQPPIQQVIPNQQQPLVMQSQPNVVPMMSQGIITTQSAIPPMTVIPQQQQQVMTSIPQQPLPVQAATIQQQMIMTQAPQQIIQPIIPQQQPPVSAIIQPIQPQNIVPKPPSIEQLSNSSLLDSLAQVQAPIVTNIPAAPTPTPPQSGNASRSMSFSEKVPSVPESP